MQTVLFNKYFQEFRKIESKEIIPGFSGKFIHTEFLTLALWTIQGKSTLPLHQHVHEQVTQLISGEFEMTIGGVYKKISTEEIVVIPSDVPHEGKALSECIVFDIFTPVREDYRQHQ